MVSSRSRLRQMAGIGARAGRASFAMHRKLHASPLARWALDDTGTPSTPTESRLAAEAPRTDLWTPCSAHHGRTRLREGPRHDRGRSNAGTAPHVSRRAPSNANRLRRATRARQHPGARASARPAASIARRRFAAAEIIGAAVARCTERRKLPPQSVVGSSCCRALPRSSAPVRHDRPRRAPVRHAPCGTRATTKLIRHKEAR
jgi:hypothetical protein